MTKFTIEKIGSTIWIRTDCDVFWDVWDESEFTERKLKNAINRITKRLCGNAEFTRTF